MRSAGAPVTPRNQLRRDRHQGSIARERAPRATADRCDDRRPCARRRNQPGPGVDRRRARLCVWLGKSAGHAQEAGNELDLPGSKACARCAALWQRRRGSGSRPLDRGDRRDAGRGRRRRSVRAHEPRDGARSARRRSRLQQRSRDLPAAVGRARRPGHRQRNRQRD